jgi:outer membrane protein assembly factor BamB
VTDPFTFVQVTDLHLSLGDPAFGPDAGDATIWFDADGMHDRIVTTPAVLDALLAQLAAHHPEAAFVVATGDLTNNGTEDELVALAAALDRSPLPVRVLPGNHDHHSAEADVVAGRPLPWERHIGPRWFSFDHGGVHFAAIDWYTHLLGIDTEEQEAWLAADLEALAPDVPVVLLTHDQMSSAFYRSLPRRPVASFSGHWHTSRVAEVDGTRHYNTGTATFGGLDYSPAHYRVCRWDGAALHVRTVARGPVACSGATFRAGAAANGADVRWTAALAGGAHLAGPVVHDDLVLAVAKDEDNPGGSLAAFDLATGAPRWTVRLDSAVKAAPVMVGTTAVAVSVTGEVVAVDAATGTERWRTRLDDPLLLWAYLRPATDGSRVYAGDIARFACIDAATGEVVWSRTDLGQRENLTTVAGPALVDGVVLVGFAGQFPALWGLDPDTGATRWPLGVEGGSMYRRPAAELAQHLPQVVMAGITPDPDGTDAYVVRLGSRVERVRAGDGAVMWSAPCTGWFNPAPPVVHGDAVVVVSSMGDVRSLDRATGAERWCTSLPHAAPVAMGSYRADGPALLAPVTADGERLIVPLGDGRLAALEASSGRVLGWADVGQPVAAPVAIAGDLCVVAPVDGVLRAVPLDAFG